MRVSPGFTPRPSLSAAASPAAAVALAGLEEALYADVQA